MSFAVDPKTGGRYARTIGGAVEFGERYEDALRREIREELGGSASRSRPRARPSETAESHRTRSDDYSKPRTSSIAPSTRSRAPRCAIESSAPWKPPAGSGRC